MANHPATTRPTDRARSTTAIGILGGTGPAGSGLARRLHAAGHPVLLGSRDLARAAARVAEISDGMGAPAAALEPVLNADAARAAIVVLATAAESAVETAAGLATTLDGRVVVCMANQLQRAERGFGVVFPAEGSVAQAVQRAAPGARVVAAFQNLPARPLYQLERPLDADVLVCGDDADAVRVVMDLAASIAGLRPIDAGPLVNAAGLEALTAVLLTINRARKRDHSVKIVELH